MRIPFSRLKNAAIEGADGFVGSVKDVLFDSQEWGVRYLVVDTGKWLPGRQVLLPPAVLEHTDWRSGTAKVSLTRSQVKASPDVSVHQPISRQKEAELMSHYAVPFYWGPAGATLAGGGPPTFPLETALSVQADSHATEIGDPHLRSASEVQGYDIRATDEAIGHVEDFVLDDDGWIVRYLVVDTRNWLPGRKVLVAIHWIEAISWGEASVTVGLTSDRIKQSPEFDPSEWIDREYEERLHHHYGRSGYWMM
ncbi:PRC-barrel domain protein [Rhodopirellula maiorica SM1]|uniref:PRC-barrel domain protein n=1 Tax=Rhodopirellula maiorica SM1 TaxID=1265738 RepID=M5R872_9BACT|nr:PRC-barrel domain-containing protein [Rhodopirellula maiorica]EMI15678.1 PRC-barrel domain protein [Rhodopirellula maiorica SM1]